LAACQPVAREEPPIADAAPDAPVINAHTVPISVTGSTPLGTLDAFGYAQLYYDYCSNSFKLVLTTTRLFDFEPRIELDVPFPETTPDPVTGPLPASVSAMRWESNYGWRSIGNTTDVTFDAAPLDPPGTSSARMVGTFKSTAPGWMLAFHVDLTFELLYVNHGGCTL
jgi:hypothetical protein